jgi:RsmE family RNA methyltransferase
MRVCLWEGDAPPIARVLGASALREPESRIEHGVAEALVLVGPEGGLARSEVEAARRAGFTPASLGPRILRTETAGPAIVAILQFHVGDLSGS